MPTAQRTISHIKIKADDNYEFGFKLGKALGAQIKDRIEKNKAVYHALGRRHMPGLIKDAQGFLPKIKRKFPELIEEIKGMSQGAGVAFEELLVLNCEEELLDFFIPRCTSVAVHIGNGEILLGHNEDWLSTYRQQGMILVDGQIKQLKFLALSFMGQLVGTSCALNSYGLTYTVNSLCNERFRYGIPRNFLLRNILEKRYLKDAEHVLLSPSRTIAANTLCVWRAMAMDDIEAFWGHHQLFHGKKWLVHTNHPLLGKDQNQKNTDVESIRRYQRVCEILTATQPNIEESTLKRVLKDHRAGICGHPKSAHSYWGSTVASAIVNPSERWIEVCYSNPCRHKYFRYYLK
ncbi:MAG: hypothetical protein A2445_00535 [Candidatus Jacksonbacteria bacterium RIFOXYC2_FULL_44_29]|nr:MAG: hypothetical protein UW45_C0029G0013 [Parcubacteria group bacterium GW2011_GWC2_44_22]OGY75786.1 MAG: hypothetical protein A2295_03310 [Candidatus Jacksonbacteria bacterium RIFOXYB2_FULL_44_15]OGY76348.1 MAG: hypothetical protein A2240_04270 [Candidatus Jacksonbacteria bacterium RIFOXYA2_FULL_43_12]OGY77985.1 MAG: hypothetical protein A2445_00535 [Candidatus Jacksonbacteria bacterium RIFOXYC2_FULL_44_29]OGY81559.1 MAG: hypothetical protein A2550_00990 [Candidatus Jacksonbacteria bacteri